MNERDFMTSKSNEKHLHEFEMQFLSRESSRKHVEIQEGLLEQTIRKESSRLLGSKQPYTQSKKKYKSVSAFQAEQPEQPSEEPTLIKFEFNFISYMGETALAYGLLISICYLIKVSSFPYFQLLLVLGLMNSISPWSITNLVMLCAGIMVICNHFLKVSVLTYPAIFICYLSVMLFNERNKTKLLFIAAFAIQLAWGFATLPGLYASLSTNSKQAFYYIFPIFMLIIRLTVSAFLKAMRYSELVFLQLPLFLMGLQYGVILTLKTSYIEYWYLMVFFTLQIINERTQFLLRLSTSLFRACRDTVSHRQGQGSDDQTEHNEIGQKKDVSILAAHASGHACIHSFHIVCLIYVFTELPIYSSPYTSGTILFAYTQQQWFMPLATWALATVYQLMCLIHERKHKDRLLIGHTKNTILYTILRGVMLTLGFWIFYLGLGVGNYIVYPQNTRFPNI